jgi:uncharacterized membrane protein YbaN (DUF454 family)
MNKAGSRGVSSFRKGLFVVAGTVFLALGGLGVFLPILPTTPFLLLSAAFYYKGSERMHRWLLNNKWFGSYIKNYKEGRGISTKGKIFTLLLLWMTISFSGLFLVDVLAIQLILLVTAAAVSIHVAALPTFRKAR